MLCAQAWKPGSQHAGEKRGVAGLLLGRTEHDEDLREPLVRRQGSQVSMRVARGSASWLSSHGRGLGPRDALLPSQGGDLWYFLLVGTKAAYINFNRLNVA